MKSVKNLNPADVHAPAGRYCHSVFVPTDFDTVYIAGQLGIDRQGNVLEGVSAQIHAAFRNLEAVLRAHDLQMNHLVKINYYLVEASHLDSLREIRLSYLRDPPPASTIVIVKALANPCWLFELDAVAARFTMAGA